MVKQRFNCTTKTPQLSPRCNSETDKHFKLRQHLVSCSKAGPSRALQALNDNSLCVSGKFILHHNAPRSHILSLSLFRMLRSLR